MLKRREFLKELGSSGMAMGLASCSHIHLPREKVKDDNLGADEKVQATATTINKSHETLIATAPMVYTAVPKEETKPILRVKNFNTTFDDDLFLEPKKIKLLKSVSHKLVLVKNYVGFGHFNLISFDEMIAIGKNYRKLAQFTKDELDFLDEVFHFNAAQYGFYGDKVLDQMTAKISIRDVCKVPHTGHYIYKSEAYALYLKIQREIGPSIILTSGVRGIVKQMQLFLAKAIRVKANMSKASRSLAPPGHSYHGIGDFDVGKVGFGIGNFTSRFAKTDEYKKLIASGYINIRYTENNPFGVRYEPWHIKVAKG